MATDTPRTGAETDEVPSHFVVQLSPGVYAICARTGPLIYGDRDLAGEIIGRYIEASPLSAAILPGWMSGGGAGAAGPRPQIAFAPATRGQTGRLDISFNLSISEDPS